MIYSGFTFLNELDLLEIRLHELDSVVDRHIIVESPWTHSGKRKPLTFFDNRDRYAGFLHKITHVVVDDMPNTGNPWDNEKFQFAAMMRGMDGANDDDLLIVSAADEIPRASSVLANSHAAPLCFELSAYGVFVNSYIGTWNHCVMIPVKLAREKGPYIGGWHEAHTFRLERNAGWHFCSCGGVESMREKYTSFAHQEQEVQKFNNPEILQQWHDLKVGMWGTAYEDSNSSRPNVIPLDGTFPEYLVRNRDKFRHLIADAQ